MWQDTFPDFHFLGLKVQGLTKADLLNVIESTIDSGANNSIIGNHNLHSLYLLRYSHEMRSFYQHNQYTHVDGMSLVMLGRLMGIPLRRIHRTGYLDWFNEFLALAESKSWRLYFLGGRQEVAVRLPSRLRGTYPNLLLRCHHGYDAFSPDTMVYEEIADFKPHIVLVGMGMPLQERWILGARERVHTNLFLQCGAIMDYYTGVQRPSPRWMGQLGLEWLFRLVCRPRSLGSRYILEPLKLAPEILGEIAVRRFQVGKS